MKEVEQYLKRATRGLWGRKHREVREELAAHISERVMAFRVAGLSEGDAVERALRELGHPREVSAGMARIYTLPTLFEMSLLAVAACVLVVTLSSSSLAQSVTGLFYYPTETCVQAVKRGEVNIGALEEYRSDTLGDCALMFDGSLWLSAEFLEQAFEPQGVDVYRDEFLTFDFPAGRVFVASDAADVQYFFGGEEVPAAQSSYISLWKLLEAASWSRDISLDVTGWDNPTVRFGDASLQIGTETQPVKGTDFYGSYLNAVLYEDLINPVAYTEYIYTVEMYNDKVTSAYTKSAPLRTLQLDTTPTSIDGYPLDAYGVVVVLDPAELLIRDMSGESNDVPELAFLTDVARVDQEGQIEVHLPTGDVQFVEILSTNPEPGTAMLVRLTGGTNQFQSWYEVVLPEQIQEVN